MVVFLMPQIRISFPSSAASTLVLMGQDDKPIDAQGLGRGSQRTPVSRRVNPVPPLPLVGELRDPEQYYLLAHDQRGGMIGGIVSAGLGDRELLHGRNTGFPPPPFDER